MAEIYKIIEHFSNYWQEYATAGAIFGFLFLTACAGCYDGKEIEENKSNRSKRKNLGILLREIRTH